MMLNLIDQLIRKQGDVITGILKEDDPFKVHPIDWERVEPLY